MKQNITPDQLNELSEKEKKRLVSWIDKHPDYSYAFKFGDQLSIGQMIEFLDDKSDQLRCLIDSKPLWKVEPLNIGNGHLDVIEPKSLCDALWSACKEILEK